MRNRRRFKLLGLGAAMAVLLAFGARALRADVVLTDKQTIRRQQAKLEKKVEHQNRTRQPVGRTGLMNAQGTGAINLIDGAGLEWFLNSDVSFSTSSSASGAMSEASYTTSMTATTLGGGSSSETTLSDAFDGYNSIAVSLTGALGPVSTGNANYIIFNKNGNAAVDPDSLGREYVFGTQYVPLVQPEPGPHADINGGLEFWRKVYVPSDDSFARWLNFVKNTSGGAVTVTLVTANNLGSDSSTRVFASSNGNTVAELTDTWVATFQNYSGTSSPDPRLAHVMQGAGSVPVPLAKVVFADGDDNPYWAYSMTIPAGETYCIMNFAVAQGSKAEAAAKAAELVGLPAAAVQYMSDAEKNQVKNFGLGGQYWVSIKSTAGGTTDPRGAFQVDAGSSLTVRAYPNAGYKFVDWTGDARGADNPFTFTVDKDMEVWANFVNLPPTVQITNPAANATVSGTVNVTATATDDSGVAKVEFYVDGALKATDTTAPYAFDWDTLAETPGSHTLKAVAYDVPGLTGSHQITVNAVNVTLTLLGSRMTDRAGFMSREYAKLEIRVGGGGTSAVQKYILYRKTGSGAFASIKELTPSEVGTSYVYSDKYLTKGQAYSYKLTAVIGGVEIVASNEVTI